jgi:hypothetical protein
MLVPGTYERGIFGDLMLPGIACGVRKILLIFNTNPQSPHDPIYVVDPRQFNMEADSVIPIILAYNQSHYESLHPCSDADIQATADLVVEYLDNRYRYSKKDFPLLLGLDGESRPMEHRQDDVNLSSFNQKYSSKTINTKLEPSPCPKKKQKIFESEFEGVGEETSNAKNNLMKKQRNIDVDTEIDLEEIDDFLDNKGRKESTEKNQEQKINDLCYKLKNTKKEHPIQEVNGKMKCPLCSALVKNIQLHFDRNVKCSAKIDHLHFKKNFKEFSTQQKKEKERIKKQTQRNAKKTDNEESYSAMKEKQRQDKQNLRDTKKVESEESHAAMKEQNRQDKQNLRDRKKVESEESYSAMKEQQR